MRNFLPVWGWYLGDFHILFFLTVCVLWVVITECSVLFWWGSGNRNVWSCQEDHGCQRQLSWCLYESHSDALLDPCSISFTRSSLRKRSEEGPGLRLFLFMTDHCWPGWHIWLFLSGTLWVCAQHSLQIQILHPFLNQIKVLPMEMYCTV